MQAIEIDHSQLEGNLPPFLYPGVLIYDVRSNSFKHPPCSFAANIPIGTVCIHS